MKRSLHPIVYPLAGLALILLFNALFSPGFFAIEVRDGQLFGSLVDILNRATPVLLLSLGMTLVIATGGIDLSVGAVMAIAGAFAAVLIVAMQSLPFFWLLADGSVLVVVLTALVITVALVVGVVCGLFNGVLIGKFGVQPIVATLILMVAGRGIAQLVTKGQIVRFDAPSFNQLGTGSAFGLPMPFVIFLVSLLIVVLVVRKTALGMFIEAVGSNAEAARLSGVASGSVKIAVYALCGLVAGIAGVIACADIQAADVNNTGLYLELDAILAVSLGGTLLSGGRFSIAGSVVGAILMQALTTTILTLGVSLPATLVAKALIIIAVILLQSPQFRKSVGLEKRVPAP